MKIKLRRYAGRPYFAVIIFVKCKTNYLRVKLIISRRLLPDCLLIYRSDAFKENAVNLATFDRHGSQLANHISVGFTKRFNFLYIKQDEFNGTELLYLIY